MGVIPAAMVGVKNLATKGFLIMGIFGKAKDALNSDKGEQISDQGLDKAAEFAKGKLGEDKADQSNSARDKADKRIGKQGE